MILTNKMLSGDACTFPSLRSVSGSFSESEDAFTKDKWISAQHSILIPVVELVSGYGNRASGTYIWLVRFYITLHHRLHASQANLIWDVSLHLANQSVKWILFQGSHEHKECSAECLAKPPHWFEFRGKLTLSSIHLLVVDNHPCRPSEQMWNKTLTMGK